jgi:hypothetical protein
MSGDFAALAMGCSGFAGLAAGLLLSAFDPAILRSCGRGILITAIGLAMFAGIALLATIGQALAR